MTDGGESTIKTGSPVAASGGPRQGEVLGERYEVQERIAQDPFTLDYRALDQETESPVLLRVVVPDLLPSAADARAAARRLSRVLGAGGAYLSPLLDADCEGPLLFTVEDIPKGPALREVVDARAARGEVLQPHEVVPVVARLAAALAAVPPPWRHGDVRAERIHFDPDRLELVCPFLLTVLPQDALARTIESDPRLRGLYAPEVPRGGAGGAADRYGVACVVFEAMTGRIPEPGAASASELGAAGEVLRRMLSQDPSARPASLEPLVCALAERAELPVPDLDPAPYRKPRRLAIHRKSERALPAVDDRMALDTIEMSNSTRETIEAMAPVVDVAHPDGKPAAKESREDTGKVVAVEGDARSDDENTNPRVAAPKPASAEGTREPSADQVLEARRIAGAGAEGTQDIDASAILEAEDIRQGTGGGEGEAKTDSGVGLDPRLVRAALGVQLEDTGNHRAVPGVEAASHPAQATAGPVTAVPWRRRASDPTMELSVQDIELVEKVTAKRPAPKTRQRQQPTSRGALTARRKRRHDPSPVELPKDIKPIPRPRLDSTPPGPVRGDQPLFDDSRGSAGPPPATPPPADMRPPPRRRGEAVTWVVDPVSQRPARRQTRWGCWVLAVAIALGAAIIGAGAWIAKQRQTEREQRLQERFERLQQQGRPE